MVDTDYGVRVVDLLPQFSRPRLIDGLELPGAVALDLYTRYRPAEGTQSAREHDYLFVAAAAAGLRVYDVTRPDAITLAGMLTNLGGSADAIDVNSHLAPPGVDDFAFIGNSELGLQVVNVNDPTQPALESTLTASGAGAVTVEVQQMDRFLDEQGRQLKENSHPFVDTLARLDIERVLSVPDVELFRDDIWITGLTVVETSVRIRFNGSATVASVYATDAAPSVLGPWQPQSGTEILQLEPGKFEARFPIGDGHLRFFQIKRVR